MLKNFLILTSILLLGQISGAADGDGNPFWDGFAKAFQAEKSAKNDCYANDGLQHCVQFKEAGKCYVVQHDLQIFRVKADSSYACQVGQPPTAEVKDKIKSISKKAQELFNKKASEGSDGNTTFADAKKRGYQPLGVDNKDSQKWLRVAKVEKDANGNITVIPGALYDKNVINEVYADYEKAKIPLGRLEALAPPPPPPAPVTPPPSLANTDEPKPKFEPLPYMKPLDDPPPMAALADPIPPLAEKAEPPAPAPGSSGDNDLSPDCKVQKFPKEGFVYVNKTPCELMFNEQYLQKCILKDFCRFDGKVCDAETCERQYETRKNYNGLSYEKVSEAQKAILPVLGNVSEAQRAALGDTQAAYAAVEAAKKEYEKSVGMMNVDFYNLCATSRVKGEQNRKQFLVENTKAMAKLIVPFPKTVAECSTNKKEYKTQRAQKACLYCAAVKELDDRVQAQIADPKFSEDTSCIDKKIFNFHEDILYLHQTYVAKRRYCSDYKEQLCKGGGCEDLNSNHGGATH